MNAHQETQNQLTPVPLRTVPLRTVPLRTVPSPHCTASAISLPQPVNIVELCESPNKYLQAPILVTTQQIPLVQHRSCSARSTLVITKQITSKLGVAYTGINQINMILPMNVQGQPSYPALLCGRLYDFTATVLLVLLENILKRYTKNKYARFESI